MGHGLTINFVLTETTSMSKSIISKFDWRNSSKVFWLNFMPERFWNRWIKVIKQCLSLRIEFLRGISDSSTVRLCGNFCERYGIRVSCQKVSDKSKEFRQARMSCLSDSMEGTFTFLTVSLSCFRTIFLKLLAHISIRRNCLACGFWHDFLTRPSLSRVG